MVLLQLQLTGTDDDLEYYVRECGTILGISQKLPPDQRTGKNILEHIFTQIVEFKKFNQVYLQPNYEMKCIMTQW